jgi:hypothetical protein
MGTKESSYAPFSKAPIIPVHFMDECHVAKIKGMAEIKQVITYISSICFNKKRRYKEQKQTPRMRLLLPLVSRRPYIHPHLTTSSSLAGAAPLHPS